MWSKTNLMGHGSSSRSATSANSAASEPVMRARYCRACGQKYFRIRQRLGRPCGNGLGLDMSCEKKKQKSEKLKAETVALYIFAVLNFPPLRLRRFTSTRTPFAAARRERFRSRARAGGRPPG